MFPGYSGQQGNGFPGRDSSGGQYSSFPQKKEKTQHDYAEENRIKFKRQQAAQKAHFQAYVDAYKEQNAFKPLKDFDSDDSDAEPMARCDVVAIGMSNGGVHDLSARSQKVMERQPTPKRERKEKKRKRHRSSSSSSSSSDSSRDRRRRRRSRSRSRKRNRSRNRSPKKRRDRSRERKSKHKKKKRRRHRSSSSSSSSSADVQVVEDRTSMSGNQRLFKKPYYKPIRESEADSLLPHQIFVHDYHAELENFTYDGVQPGQRSEIVPETFLMPYIVTNTTTKDLGKDDRAVPKETDGKKKKKQDKRIHQVVPNPKKTENEFRKLEWDDHEDGFVPIAQTDGKFQYLHEIADEKREEERRLNAMDEIRREDRVPFDEDKALMEARLKIRENPKDPESYINFLKVQDSVYERDLRIGTLSGNVAVRNERKLAIVDEGIRQCPRDVSLRVEKAKILGEVDAELAYKEWEDLTHKFVNNLYMWETYHDTLLNDSRMFNMQRIDKAFSRCYRNLTALVTGEIKSHQVDPTTDNFLLKLFIRQLMFFVSTGYVERAIASIQASIEFSFFQPPQLKSKQKPEKLTAFEEFWSSGLPRIGDKGSQGWDKYEPGKYSEMEIRNMEAVELELENGRFAKLKQRVGEQRHLDRCQKYVYLEKAAQRIFCRPQRHRENFMDNGNNVDGHRYQQFKDILVRELSRGDVFEVLSAFGMKIIGHDTMNPSLCELAEQFGISDQQPILPPPAHKILCRITRTIALHNQNPELMFSLVHSYITVLEASNISKETAMHRFLTFVKRLKERPDGSAVVQKKRKKKKGYESSDEEDDDEPFPCMKTGPLSDIYWNLIDCYAINATLSCDLLRRNDCFNRAILMVDEMVGRMRVERQEEELNHQKQYLGTQMVLALINFVVQKSMDCKPEERMSMQKTLNDKLVDWVCRILQLKEDRAQPVSALHAHTYLTTLSKRKVDTLRGEEGLIAGLMPDCRSLAFCLLMWMAALRGDVYNAEYTKQCHKVWEDYRNSPDANSQVFVHSTLLAILQREWTWFHRSKKELNEELRVHLQDFPTSTEPIKIAIDMISKSGGVIQYSRRLDHILGNYGGSHEKSRRALAHVAVVDKKKKYIEEALKKENRGNDALDRISGMLSDVLSREADDLSDPYMWRMALNKTTCSRAAQELYIKANSKCRWDRQLHLDIMTRSDEARATQTYNLMDESFLRHLTNIEDVDIYMEMVEAQKKAAETEGST